MKQFILKYKNYIIGILGVFSLILLLLGKKTPPLPQIVNFTPTNLLENVDLRNSPNYISNIPLNLNDLTISSSPTINLRLITPSPNTFIATHSLAFQPATTYTLTLSWQGHVLQTHSFTTIKSQEDPLLIQNMNDELARDYPLAQKLPYDTLLYHVVYSAPMTLEITLKNPNLTSEEAINDIKSWVTKNGGDANAHKYIISSGNMSPSPKPSTGALSTSPLR